MLYKSMVLGLCSVLILAGGSCSTPDLNEDGVSQELIQPIVQPRFLRAKLPRYQQPVKWSHLKSQGIENLVSVGRALKPGHFWLLQPNHQDAWLPVLLLISKEGIIQSYHSPDIQLRDLSSVIEVELEGENYLLLGELRDINFERDHHRLFLIKTDSLINHTDSGDRTQAITFHSKLDLIYPESESRDGVDMAWDPSSKELIILANNSLGNGILYRANLSSLVSDSKIKLELLTTSPVEMSVGLDIKPAGDGMLISSFNQALYYGRSEGADWIHALQTGSSSVEFPERRRISDVVFRHEGFDLLLLQGRSGSPDIWQVQGK